MTAILQTKQTNALDYSAFWMPFTENQRFLSAPKVLNKAKGVYYWDDKGRRILDGVAGMWCVNAGHAHPKIIEAVTQQMQQLDYASNFRLVHHKALELANRLKHMTPGNLNHMFFSNSGSEAVDTALKIAMGYHALRGESERKILVGRDRAYHGVGFGGIAVGGFEKNRQHFHLSLQHAQHMSHTHNLNYMAFSRGQPAWGVHLADELEGLVQQHGEKSIAAVIIEPVAGSTGVLVPPVGYLERLREICTRHGILLIFDEVITAFGRLGEKFAADYFGIQPDIITSAKGITSGTIPLGATMVSDEIYETFMSQSEGVEFCHGYTYSGHPVASAAALATLDVYENEGLFEHARHLSSYFENALHSLNDIDGIVDIRNIGLMGAIQLDPAGEPKGERAMRVFNHCFEQGLLVRVTGDTIALSPALCIDEAQIDQIVDVLRNVLTSV